MVLDDTPPPKEEVNLANAVDLSDSEEEEVLEDIVDDFSVPLDITDVRMRLMFLTLQLSQSQLRIQMFAQSVSISSSFQNHSQHLYPVPPPRGMRKVKVWQLPPQKIPVDPRK